MAVSFKLGAVTSANSQPVVPLSDELAGAAVVGTLSEMVKIIRN